MVVYVLLIILITYVVMCNFILLVDAVETAKKNKKTLYEEWWTGNDTVTHALMIVFYPIISMVTLISWIRMKH